MAKAAVQGKNLFFHFTRPLDEYFPDFGCPNIKSTRPKNDDNEPLLLISYSKWRRRVDVMIRDACAHGRYGSEGWHQRSKEREGENKFFLWICQSGFVGYFFRRQHGFEVL